MEDPARANPPSQVTRKDRIAALDKRLTARAAKATKKDFQQHMLDSLEMGGAPIELLREFQNFWERIWCSQGSEDQAS